MAAIVICPAPPICSDSARYLDSSHLAHLHELSENETGRTCADKEDLRAERHLDLVHTVDGTRSGLEQGSLLVREVLDLVAFGEMAVEVSISIDRVELRLTI